MTVNFADDLILVTCASGKQCKYLLPQLTQKWKRIRLAVNSRASEERLKKQYPDAEVTRADMSKPDECARLLKDVTTVYHVGPTYHPHETEMAYFMIDAAVEESKRGSFKHFLLSSVLNPQFRKMLNHTCKFFEEEYLMESGLNWTIIQPAHFMDTFPLTAFMQQEKPVYMANWDPAIKFSFIATKDLGDAVGKIAEEREQHYFAQYPLAGDGIQSYNERMAIVSRVIGQDIEVKKRPFEEAVDAFLTVLAGGREVRAHMRDTAERMLLFYNRRGLIGNSNVLRWLIGREPTSHEAWARMQVDEYRRESQR